MLCLKDQSYICSGSKIFKGFNDTDIGSVTTVSISLVGVASDFVLLSFIGPSSTQAFKIQYIVPSPFCYCYKSSGSCTSKRNIWMEVQYVTYIHSILVCCAIAVSASICGHIVWIFKSKNSINKINLCTYIITSAHRGGYVITGICPSVSLFICMFVNSVA